MYHTIPGSSSASIYSCLINETNGSKTYHPEYVALGVRYVELPQLFAESDIVTLRSPLQPETHHLIDAQTLQQMKPGVMLINTSRGALLDTQAVIEVLKSDKIEYLGLDVYEEEVDLFFRDLPVAFCGTMSSRGSSRFRTSSSRAIRPFLQRKRSPASLRQPSPM